MKWIVGLCLLAAVSGCVGDDSKAVHIIFDPATHKVEYSRSIWANMTTDGLVFEMQPDGTVLVKLNKTESASDTIETLGKYGLLLSAPAATAATLP